MTLTTQQLTALRGSLRSYSGQVSDRLLADLLAKYQEVLRSILEPVQVERDGKTVTEGYNPATARNAISRVLEKNAIDSQALADRIDFALRIATEVARGAGNYVKEGLDQDVVDAYPAWELLRVYPRDVPRGFTVGPKGTLITVPDDDWPSRWQAALDDAGDEAAAVVFESTGRMIALKSSDIWQSLGDGAGGHDDTLGNPFPPFAFNSGFDVDNVSRQECEDLGLIGPDDDIKPGTLGLKGLFAPIEEAA